MKMIKTFSLLIMIVLIKAQTSNFIHHSQSMGLANATVTAINSNMASYTNPAVLALQEENLVNLTANMPYINYDFFKAGNLYGSYNVEDFGRIALTLDFFQVKNQDKILMAEHNYILSHAFQLMKDISTSLQFGYNLRVFYLEFNQFEGGIGTESTTKFLLDLAFHSEIYNRIYLAAFIKNIGNTKIGRFSNHELLREVQVGISYEPYDGLRTSIDMSKEVDNTPRYHFAAEMNVYDEKDTRFDLRIGTVSNPNQLSFGFGLRFGEFQLDYGFLSHIIDNSQSFSLIYFF
jgi:hypothetical protein